MEKINISGWKKFRVGDLFTAVRGQSKPMQTLKEGSMPVVGAARKNQGIGGYYDVPSEQKDAITVSCNGSAECGSTFYHDYPFAVTGDAMVLRERKPMTPNAKRFVSAVYDSYFVPRYNYKEKCSPDKAMSEEIPLPSTPSGEPDWEYMDAYMERILVSMDKTLTALMKVAKGGGETD